MRGMSDKMIKDSKYLSYLLRHHPEEAGCSIDNHGWVDVEILIENTKFTLQDLKEIIKKDSRYEFSKDRSKIRAFHGHSIPGIVCEEEVTPSDILYHGTSIDNKDKIFQSEFIKKQSRTWVHLSENLEDAKRIGKRHGKPVVLLIDAKKMHEDGIKFYKTRDGVYLTDDISIKYIEGVDYC